MELKVKHWYALKVYLVYLSSSSYIYGTSWPAGLFWPVASVYSNKLISIMSICLQQQTWGRRYALTRFKQKTFNNFSKNLLHEKEEDRRDMTAFEFDVRQLLACSWSCFGEFCLTFTRTSQYLYLDSFETRTGWLSVSLWEYSKCSSKLKFKSSNSNGFMIACIEKLSLWDVRQCPAITSDLIKLSDACLGEI